MDRIEKGFGMVYFAETAADNGDVRELHVFADEAGRDAWVAADVPEADESNGWEVGPREAVDGDAVRDGFRDEDDMPGFEWVTLHSGVRIFGRRANTPGWLDLDDFSEQHNMGSGIDWSRDVSFVWDHWSTH